MNVCVIYERSETGWCAYTPGLPGIGVTGKTIEDVRASVKLAIEMHVDGMSQESLAEAETLGDFAELLEAGPPVPEYVHRAILRRDRLIA